MSIDNLLLPIKIGSCNLNNRFVSVFTNSKIAEQSIASYSLEKQDISCPKAGLIISEPTTVFSLDDRYQSLPRIYTLEQTRKWRKITESIHKKGGKVFLQLWHGGSEQNPCLLDGKIPSMTETTVHEKKSLPDIQFEAWSAKIFQQFRSSTQNALTAEFDGVEIHLCPGQLIDSLIDDNRQNFGDYARDLERRIQLFVGVVEAVANVIDEERVGIKIAPSYKLLGFNDPDPEGTFYYLLDTLDFYNLAYVHLIEPQPEDSIFDDVFCPMAKSLRSIYRKNFMLNVNNNVRQAEAMVNSGAADLIACHNTNNINHELSNTE